MNGSPNLPPNCPDCGNQLPEGSLRDLCPSCLLKQAFASRTFEESGKSAEPPPPPEEIADRFPQFEITECLGRGGMGVVYKARQKSLNRWVAIKILAPEKVGEEAFAERFVREAQTLAQLNHPNIVTVFDYGDTEGLYYIVMEFVDGVNLRDLLADGQMKAEEALAIVPPVCEALQFAHDKGIVHRDIKPENLLVDRDGRVKIADFGIASLIGADSEKSGTPPYMAPEQGTQDGVDHRADIYALGVVLYEMLTGERPSSPLDLPSQKVRLDIRIDDIVLRALNHEPERRYRTANDFRTMVEGVSPAESTQEPKLSPSGGSPPIDARFEKGVGIAIMIVGALNGLSTLVSLLAIPFFSIFRIGAEISYQESSMVGFIVVLSVIFTLTVSVLCVIGGNQMYRGGSRNWSLVGAVACCLTPLLWPLGLFLGVGSIILLVLDKSPKNTASTEIQSPRESVGPRLSAMAVVACLLVTIPVLLFVLLFTVSLA